MTLPLLRLCRLAAPLVLALGCRASEQNHGTLVGNPGSAGMTVASTGSVPLSSARLAVADLIWRPCDASGAFAEPIDQTVELLDLPVFEAPTGHWCGMDVAAAGPLELTDDQTGTSVTLEVTLVELQSTGFGVGQGDTVLIELGQPEWLAGLTPGALITPESGAEHDDLVAVVELASTAFRDDGDLQVDDGERAAGPVASGVGVDDDEEDDEEDDDDD